MPKVKHRFRDKENFKFYNKGDEYEHENQHRIDELIDKGFLQGKPKPKKNDESPKNKK